MRATTAFLALLAAVFGAEAAAAKCTVENFGLLQVTMQGPRPITQGEINGHPVRFMVDSGAFYSLLGPAMAKELKLSTTLLPHFDLRGVGGGSTASVTKVDELKIAGVPLRNISFIVGGSDTGLAGVIGQNILGLQDVEYDLSHGAVRLMLPKDCSGLSLAYWSGDRPVTALPLERPDERNPHTIATVLVNGVKLRALFDTGAGSSAIKESAARKAGVKLDSPGVMQVGYARGLGSKQVPVWRAPFASIDFGGEKLNKITLTIQDFGGDVDMLIGADFFLAHRVYVSKSQNVMYFTYEGGPIFGVSPQRAVGGDGQTIAVTDTGAEPTDAAGYSARGTASAAKRDFASALADLNKAIELAPGEARYYFQRSQVRLGLQQQPAAVEDINKAKALAPADPDILMAHAAMSMQRRDRAAAIEDAKAADAALAPEVQARLALAQLYGSLGDREAALTNFDTWLRFHSQDAQRTVAFNGRCYTRALLNRDLDKALSDCNSAIRLQPNVDAFLDSRGLVHMRRGEYQAAIDDYTAVLNMQPNRVMARYARSLAETRLGKADEAKRDSDAALAIDPRIAEAATRIGL